MEHATCGYSSDSLGGGGWFCCYQCSFAKNADLSPTDCMLTSVCSLTLKKPPSSSKYVEETV